MACDHVLNVFDVPVVLVELPYCPLQVLGLLVLPVDQTGAIVVQQTLHGKFTLEFTTTWALICITNASAL